MARLDARPTSSKSWRGPANERYDIWRYDSRDDYTGEGLEKPKSILKPI